MPDQRTAFTSIIRDTGPQGYTLGLARENVQGYEIVDRSYVTESSDEIEKLVGDLNDRLGLEPYEAWRIVASSIKGAK